WCRRARPRPAAPVDAARLPGVASGLSIEDRSCPSGAPVMRSLVSETIFLTFPRQLRHRDDAWRLESGERLRSRRTARALCIRRDKTPTCGGKAFVELATLLVEPHPQPSLLMRFSACALAAPANVKAIRASATHTKRRIPHTSRF